MDFSGLEKILLRHYPYVDRIKNLPVGMGKTFFIGNDKDNCIKLDLYYTDNFIENFCLSDGIRLATVNELLAMKLDVICRGGRKKDFLDVHELMNEYSLKEMIGWHRKRYPYNHNPGLLLKKLTDFSIADQDFDPYCLLGKHWEIIKLDIIDFVGSGS